MRYADRALAGRQGDARWGTSSGFPVLYLGRPTDSVVIEAYRHLVDPVDDPNIINALAPRVLITCTVNVSEVLDLTSARSRLQTGLSLDELLSSTDDHQAYAHCQEIAQVAHQLGLHGILAPSATGIGETLALFTDLLPNAERPEIISEEAWPRLPSDPRRPIARRLQVVRDLPDPG